MKRTENTKYERKRRMPPSGPGDQKDKLKSIKTTGRQKIVIFVVFLTALITTFLGSALNLSVPAMTDEFGCSVQDAGWVVTIYMLTCASLAIPFGAAADCVGRYQILRLGLLIFSAAAVSAAFAENLRSMLLIRLGQGIGASMIFATNLSILVGAFDERRRGKVLGISTSATYIGLSLGPVLGGILSSRLGWQSVFFFAAAVSVTALAGSFFLGKEAKSVKAPDSHTASAVSGILLTTSVGCSMYGLSRAFQSLYALLFLAAGIFLFFVFFKIEKRNTNPMINFRLFRENRAYTFANLAALIQYGSVFAANYVLSLYLQTIKELSAQTAGMILAVSTILMALLSPLIGKKSDKFSPEKISAVGMAVCAGSLAVLCFLQEKSSIWLLIAVLAVSGMGSALFAAPNTSVVMSWADEKNRSSIASVLATMRSMGHTTAMVIVTAVTGIKMGSKSFAQAEPQVFMETMHLIFPILTGWCVLGIFMAIRRKM